MNYDLHEKANDLILLHFDMKRRIIGLQGAVDAGIKMFPELTEKHTNRIDTCKRGLERIEQAYIKVLTEILAV